MLNKVIFLLVSNYANFTLHYYFVIFYFIEYFCSQRKHIIRHLEQHRILKPKKKEKTMTFTY